MNIIFNLNTPKRVIAERRSESLLSFSSTGINQITHCPIISQLFTYNSDVLPNLT